MGYKVHSHLIVILQSCIRIVNIFTPELWKCLHLTSKTGLQGHSCDSEWPHPTQYSTVQYSIVQYSTVQYSDGQYHGMDLQELAHREVTAFESFW